MKKLFALVLALAVILAAVPASALTVGGFVKLYNKAVGNGSPLYPDTALISEPNKVWFLESDTRCQVAVLYNPVDGADPLNYPVTAACVIRRSNGSVGVFLNSINAAMAALYPEIPEEERMAEITRSLIEGVRVRSYSDTWDESVYYVTTHMGLFTYQEKDGTQTFLAVYGE